jgi:endonuclease/exonuclease/phosphatase family metal-dependent hydrolase
MLRLSLVLCLAACGADAPESMTRPDAGVSPAADASARTDSGKADDVEASSLRVMTYNIKHGDVTSLGDVAEVIRAQGPDIVALQEVDKETNRSDGVFQSYRLGQLTGMASAYRGAFDYDGGQYGLAILSRFPILSSTKLEMTSSGEQRIAVAWKLQLGDESTLVVINTHLGLSAAERTTQIEELVAYAEEEGAGILTGDFNALPDSAEMAPLDIYLDAHAAVGDGDGYSFPAHQPEKRIDYVLLQSVDWEPLYSQVVETVASDHRPVVVELE